MNRDSDHAHEANKIAEYLLSVPAAEQEQSRYAEAMAKLDIRFSPSEQALWDAMMKSRWQMACIDAGLALLDRRNPVRRKLLTMLAILEASPRYTHHFLSSDHSPAYSLNLIVVGLRAAARAFAGCLIVKRIQSTCP